MEKFKRLNIRLTLFLFMFIGLSVMTTMTSYANDDINQENSVEVGSVISEESAEIEDGENSQESNVGQENNQEISSDGVNGRVDISESEGMDDITQKLGTSDSDVKPQIDFTYLGVTPINPMQGQEFTVRYKLTPNPFQHNISKPKEIVLVLDGSGSMSGTKLTNLKKAAKEFINRLKDVDNLKVAIVVFSSNATINPISVSGTKSLKSVDGSSHSVTKYDSLANEYFLDIQDSRLLTMIDKIQAKGGTNTGDGLRKAEYLLGQKGDSTANKTIILMSDGLPTFYSGSSQSGTNYYTDFKDDTAGSFTQGLFGSVKYDFPYLRGVGNESSSSNVNTSTEYAKTIGNIIRKSNYNIFSIGYGLGPNTSTANKKLQEIHTSMGGAVTGDNSTFFASDEGAIDAVFEKIAEQLIKSYSFNDAQLNLQLADSVTLLEETTIVNGIKIDPIVYELGDNNWYHAPEQIIEFKLKVDTVGEIDIFNSDTNLSYTDIYGNKQYIDIESPKITIIPFDVDALNKLMVDFQSLSNGYLIGDTAVARVTAIRPNVTNINFNKLKFTLNSIPSNLQLVGGNTILNFGTVSQTTSLDYNFIINNDSEITDQSSKQYTLVGAYNYEIKQGLNTKNESDTESTTFEVKRGQVKVRVIDESGNNISQLSTVSMKDSNYQGIYKDGYILFDTVPSGNYELLLEHLPEGLQISEDKQNAKVMINFERNIAEYTFEVQGNYEDESYPQILANLKSDSVISAFNGQEIELTYTIEPKEFSAPLLSSDGTKDIVFVVDTSSATNNDRLTEFKNALQNIFLDASFTKRENKVGIVQYGNEVTSVFLDPYEKDQNGVLRDYRGMMQVAFSNVNNTNSSERKLGEALEQVVKYFNNSSKPDSEKYIVLFSGDTPTDDVKNYDLSDYNLITLAVNQIENVRNLHVSLGGKLDSDGKVDKDYFYENSHQNGHGMADPATKIRDKILSGRLFQNYKFKTVLNFDFGTNFLPMDSLIQIDTTRYQLNIPEIIYESGSKNEDGTYNHQSDSFDVTFKIKVNTEQLGEITFDNRDDKAYNNIAYKDLNDKNVVNLIETPKVEIINFPIEINHGLYGGINVDKTGIDIIPSLMTIDGQDLRKTFVESSTINFAGLISYHPNLREITLYTNQDLNITENNIELYKVITGSNAKIKLEKIIDVKYVSSSMDNYQKTIFEIPENLGDVSAILIRYSAIAPAINEGTFKNIIEVGIESQSVEIKTIKETDENGNSNLPNLF